MSSVAATVALVLSAFVAPLAMAQAAPDTSQSPSTSTNPALQAGPVTLLFGGFSELATIYRNKDESADVGSSFSGVPMANTEQAYVSEFRETARQSRLSILAQTQDMGGYKAETYFEMDFLGAAAHRGHQREQQLSAAHPQHLRKVHPATRGGTCWRARIGVW